MRPASSELSRRLFQARRGELFSENESVGQVLGRLPVLRRLGLNAALFFVRAHWPVFVGEALAPHTVPWSLKDGVLKVKADSPLHRQELTYALARVARIAKDHLGEDLVQRVEALRQ